MTRADVYRAAKTRAEPATLTFGTPIIEPGKPAQNAFVESFNGKFRDKCQNLHWLRSLRHAREEVARWRAHYNTERPHSALGYLSPKEFPMTNPAPSLETLAVSAPPLNTAAQPENSGFSWP